MTQPTWNIINDDALHALQLMPDNSVDTIITSPPYWGLRDYGVDGQLGLEQTPDCGGAFTRRPLLVRHHSRR